MYEISVPGGVQFGVFLTAVTGLGRAGTPGVAGLVFTPIAGLDLDKEPVLGFDFTAVI